MKHSWSLATLLCLPMVLAIPPDQGAAPPTPPPTNHAAVDASWIEVVTPDTAANRALRLAVYANDPGAVQQAFARGADANATVGYAPVSGGTTNTHASRIFARIGPKKSDDSDRPQAVAIFRQFVDRGVDIKEEDEPGRNATFYALLLEDVDLLRFVLDKGGDVKSLKLSPLIGGNAVNEVVMMTPPTHEDRCLPLLKLVLDQGADPNLYDSRGMTPLLIAAEADLPSMTGLLLQHGADPAAANRAGTTSGIPPGMTPLIMAERVGSKEIVKLLTAAKPNLTPVEAATTGNAPALQKLLDTGLDPNSKDESGTPFLVLAAASGDTASVHLLVERKADVNAASRSGFTALHRSAALGHTEVVRLLLDSGADPNVTRGKTPWLQTPLLSAIQAAQADVVDLLLKRGAAFSVPGNQTALEVLVESLGRFPPHQIGQARQDIKRGKVLEDDQERIYDALIARVDVRKSGGPALCQAVNRGALGVAEDLLQRGADINAQDHDGKSLTQLTVEAIGRNRNELSSEIIKAEDISPKDLAERRQSIQEADREMMHFLRLLLQKKPDVNAQAPLQSGENERTALEAARSENLSDIVTLLKKAGAYR